MSTPRKRHGPNPGGDAGHAPGRFSLTPEIVADLRTDHAGETGAVWMYCGVLRVTRDEALREFARRHRATEETHLRRIEAWLAPGQCSRLLPLWRLAGWLTGALPALLGPNAVYATVEAVERFVDRHYAEQLARLHGLNALTELRQTLAECRDDELEHRDEAAAAQGARTVGLVLRAWTWLVGAGSLAAVAVCRRV
jgi:ubiquinone biosynthesis monooxygenase Coq7